MTKLMQQLSEPITIRPIKTEADYETALAEIERMMGRVEAGTPKTFGGAPMSDDYEQYEIECARIRESNQQLLEDFAAWLRKSGLSDKTIHKHTENIDFYINEFLLYEDAEEPQEGVYQINMYLGYWFIRKAGWASPAAIKSNAASLKKFYTFLHERGLVSQEDLDELKATIKEEMPEWLATVNRYDDPSISDMNEVWGW